MKKKIRSLIPFAIITSIIFISYLVQRVPKSYGSDDPLNVYQKFQAGETIQYLVIGDSIGRGSGAESPRLKWFNQLEAFMETNHDIRMDGQYIVQSGSTAFEGLYKLTKERHHDHRDLIFIVFGENDRKYMNVGDFSRTYEAIVRTAKELYPEAEIFTITESCLKYEEFAEAISVISGHYGATNIDMRPVFKNSGLTEKQLTKDLVHPNGHGYSFYAEAIYKAFLKNLSAGKEIAKSPPPLRKDSNLELREYSQYERMSGFRPRAGYYTNNVPGSYIDYEFSGTVLGVRLLRSPDGGNVDVFIDGQKAAVLNTWWPFARERYLFIANGLSPGNHTVRFEIPKRNEEHQRTGQFIRIASIIHDKKPPYQ